MQLRANDALIIVDLQRDFCPGGKLPVAEGDEIVPIVNRLIDEATAAGALVVASRDWHPPDHSSFTAAGGPWPEHCVRGTEGARFHKGLRLPGAAIIVSKGESPERDQYSAFDATGLADELRRRDIKRVIIGGLAQEICVRATALDAAGAGFRTHVALPATRPITSSGGKAAIADMVAAGIFIEDELGASLAEAHEGKTMPDINTEKVCFVIVKARELESEDEGIQADSSNPADDKFISVLTEDAYSPVRQELVDFIDAMDEDEQTELVALTWVGRGDFTAQDWDAAVALARERHKGPTSRYLLGIPLLAGYLEAGLSEFDESCEDFESDRQ